MTVLLVVVGLVAALVAWVGVRAIKARRGTPGRMRHAVRYRLRRVRLPRDWWEQFENDFAAYVDPRSVRARNRERR